MVITVSQSKMLHTQTSRVCHMKIAGGECDGECDGRKNALGRHIERFLKKKNSSGKLKKSKSFVHMYGNRE